MINVFDTYRPPRLLLISLLLFLTGCQISPSQPPATVHLPGEPATQARSQHQLLQKLYLQHEQWHGTPYRIGGASRSGIDCSAFVQLTYRDIFKLDLPRTALDQARHGQRIAKNQLQPGDLVFFRRGNHVGIYLENNQFLHASTSQGVMISSLDNIYWNRHFWRAVSFR